MYGETVSKLLLYLAPLVEADLVDYGYNTTALENLLAEKAAIVYSYLPRRYRAIYQGRVYRLVVVPFAYAGQVSVIAPFSSMSSIVGYLNPIGKLAELIDAETTAVVYDSPNLTFSALSKGDVLVVDFDNVMSGFDVPALIWATTVLAAIDLMSIISGELESAELIPRIRADGERVFRWLEALNSPNLEDRVIIKELEYDFWEGEKTFAENVDRLMNEAAKGFTA